MIAPLAIGLAGVLAAIALLHLGWALGLRWPGTDEASLVALVIGRTRTQRMPSAPVTVAVAAAILCGAVLVVAVSARLPPAGPPAALALAAYVAFGGVFLLRGLSGFAPAVWRHTEGTPFHRLNRLYYSPLCLLIAAGLTANLFIR